MPLLADPVRGSSSDDNSSEISAVGETSKAKSTMTHHSTTDKMRTEFSSRQIYNERDSDSFILSSLSTNENRPYKVRRVSNSTNASKDSFPFVLAPPNLATPPVLRNIPRRRITRLAMSPSSTSMTYENVTSSLYNIEMKLQPMALSFR